MDYNEYLRSEYWKKRRYAALERANFKCELCGEINSLEVHHKTYERLGNEDPSDLVVICKGHHWIEHNGNELGHVEQPTVKNIEQPEAIIDTNNYCIFAQKRLRDIEKFSLRRDSNGRIMRNSYRRIKRIKIKLSKHYEHCKICMLE